MQSTITIGTLAVCTIAVCSGRSVSRRPRVRVLVCVARFAHLHDPTTTVKSGCIRCAWRKGGISLVGINHTNQSSYWATTLCQPYCCSSPAINGISWGREGRAVVNTRPTISVCNRTGKAANGTKKENPTLAWWWWWCLHAGVECRSN